MKLIKWVVCVVIVVWHGNSPVAQAGFKKVKSTTLFNGETIQEYLFDNGLKLLVVPRHQAAIATYQMWFNVGSIHEKLDPKLKKTGLAHLFEHMMFRGTEKHPDGKFDELVARMGGEGQNATTSYYRTNYFESVPASQLGKLLELESDRMRNLKLDAGLIEKEKGAVVGEYRRHMDNPTGVAFDELMRLSYEKLPYRYTILGTEAEIKGFSLEEAKYFYQTFYAPNNATIIIVGDVFVDKLLELVDDHYGKMKRQEIPKTVMPEEPHQKKERRLSIDHPQATSETLLIGYKIPDVNSPTQLPLSLLSAHLSTGMESRLRKLLVDSGVAVNVAASVDNQPDVFEIFVQLVEGKKSEQALAMIDRELKNIAMKGITDPDLLRALNQEKLSTYGGIVKNETLARFMGEYLMLSGNYLRGFEILEGYPKVSPKDVQAVAKEFLTIQNRTVIMIRPGKKHG